ncbi:amidohydrolase family protein [Pseudonocardia alaniniphila]|uniref:Amidohydrolase family protein n=1 Tax=Pseudonocardia alaniniphila TaxID=75291 RepID=A0ABS9TUR8_9PSEU|nr:amidohydrolase family protein [Pseudonocardia alaniniphila]MCH6172305.1 amidohydrolase family protein [Pseudonocardia alaniniphila]
MADSTLIRGGSILTMDARDTELPAGDLLVTGDSIAGVGTELDAPPGTEVIDATGLLVLPGLVDTHRHTWQTPLRHLGAEWSLDDYARLLLGEVGARYEPSDVYAGTLLGALGALDAGITTLVDWAHIQNSPAHADASVAALRDAGIRAVFGHGWSLQRGWTDSPGPHPADIRRVRTDLLADDDALVTLAMGAQAPDFVGIEGTARDFALARELDIPITSHVAGGRAQAGHRGIAELERAGLLGPDVTLVHVNRAPVEDLRRLADHGGHVSISPQLELTMPGMGSDVAVRRMLAAGLRPSLSADSEVCSAPDLFTQMRIALAVHRAEAPEEVPLPAREVLRMVTDYGARAAGLADRVGSLTPGKAADVVLLRTDGPGFAPMRAPANAVVLAAHPGLVDTVLVGGRVVKRSGRLLADLDRARDLAAATAARFSDVLIPVHRRSG